MTVSSGHPAAPARGYVQVSEDSAEPQFRVWAEPLHGRPTGIVLAVHVEDGPQVLRGFALDAEGNLIGHGARPSGPAQGPNGTLMARKINNCLGAVTGHTWDTAAGLRLRTWSG